MPIAAAVQGFFGGWEKSHEAFPNGNKKIYTAAWFVSAKALLRYPDTECDAG
jgi:hypothetical protein